MIYIYTRFLSDRKPCSSTLFSNLLVVFPMIYNVLYIPGGPGFLPSTVCCTTIRYMEYDFKIHMYICFYIYTHIIYPLKIACMYSCSDCIIEDSLGSRYKYIESLLEDIPGMSLYV